MVVRRHADLYGTRSGRSRGQHHRRGRPGWQAWRYRRQPLLDELAGPEQIGSGLEEQLDLRQLLHRLGAQVVQVRETIHGSLEGHGNELLDVRGRQAQAGGLDEHPRRGELGEHIDLLVRERSDAQQHHARGRGDDKITELQAGTDDPAHQRPWLVLAHYSPLMSYSAPSSWVAPTVTTGVPTAGPLARIAVLPSMARTVMLCRTKLRAAVSTKVHVEPSVP